MSASREKKTRQEPAFVGEPGPKTAREAQQQKEARRSNVLYATIAVVFVLVAIAAFVWRSNIIPKSATAVSVNGENYKVAEVDFYYQNVYQSFMQQFYSYFSYMDVNPSISMKDQTVNALGAMFTGATEGQTWYDYLMDQTLQQIINIQALCDAAEADGFTWTDEMQAEMDATMTSIEASFGGSVKQYVKQVFGGTMTEKVFREEMKRSTLASAYMQDYQDSLTYSTADLTTAYSADPNLYDLVSYEGLRISGTAATTDADGNAVEVTDEMEAAALAEAKDLADKLYAQVQDGAAMADLAEANEKASLTKSDSATYSDSVLYNWLFDDSRKAGDRALLEDEATSTYYVVEFSNRHREDYNTVDVRHILVTVNEADLDAESETYEADLQSRKDEAKAKAEELLAQWQSGEATEDSFAALANESSEDGGSNTNGGLYSGFPQGQMVPEFNDWSFDTARKVGDTGIVYGESANYKGYHVMFFSGSGLPYWQVQVSDTLKNEDLTTWHAEKIEGYTAEPHSFGLKFVG